jgi:hypothetical protein
MVWQVLMWLGLAWAAVFVLLAAVAVLAWARDRRHSGRVNRRAAPAFADVRERQGHHDPTVRICRCTECRDRDALALSLPPHPDDMGTTARERAAEIAWLNEVTGLDVIVLPPKGEAP